MTTQDFNLVICILDLNYDEKIVKVKYYYLDLQEINIRISINLRLFKFKYYFGMIFYNSNNEYSGYNLFNFPNITSNNRINNTFIEIKLFEDGQSYIFSISENFEIINNIYGGEEKIKIINFVDKYSSGIILKSFNLDKEVSINDELDINDKIIFQPNITGAIPGEYILEFSPIAKYPNADSIADKIEYYGNTSIINEELYQTFSEDIFKLIYKVECHEKCETCKQLGSDAFLYCVKCVNDFPYNFNNGGDCINICDNYIYKDEYGILYCIDNCPEDKFKYSYNENERYCLFSCLYNNEELFLDEENNICYNSCSESTNGKIYSFQKKCVNQCPDNYIPNSNNICVLYNDSEISSSYYHITSTNYAISTTNNLNSNAQTSIIFESTTFKSDSIYYTNKISENNDFNNSYLVSSTFGNLNEFYNEITDISSQIDDNTLFNNNEIFVDVNK